MSSNIFGQSRLIREDACQGLDCRPFEPRGRALMEFHPQDDGTNEDNLASNVKANDDEYWTIRDVPNGEEQLYSKGKCVYWTRNSLIIKSFNFTDRVVKVFWSRFDQRSNSNRDHVCVALTSGLSIFNTTGQHFQVPLSFDYQDIHASNSGIIIERNCDSSDDFSSPALYALTHPTQEVSPILFRPISKGPHYGKIILTCSAPNIMSVVGCHHILPVCLIYNSQDNQHSIWRIRNSTQDEIDEFQRMNEDSTTNTFANNQSSCSFREGLSHGSLNLSSKQRSSLLHQSSNPSSNASTINFSPKMDLRSRHSALGSLAASRLGIGGALNNVPESNVTNLKSCNSIQTIMSTPNRNRIINYLRDNIEEPILPELTLEQIWIEASSSCTSKANKFFITTDQSGEEFIVMVKWNSDLLTMIRREKSSDKDKIIFGRVAHIDAIDAMPIPSMKMMVVIDVNKCVALYSGVDRVTNVTIPPMFLSNPRLLPTSSPNSSRTSVTTSPIQASSARKRTSTSDRSSIGSEFSFHQMFQTLSPVPHIGKQPETKASSPVCTSDIKKIEHVVGHTVYALNNNGQRSRFDIPTVCQHTYVSRLFDAMKSLVSKDLGLMMTTKWYQIRRSWANKTFMSVKEELELFKKWFLESIGIEGCIFIDDDCKGRISEISFKAVQPSPNKKSRRLREQDSNLMMANVHTLFYAIHLVCEESLLMRLNYDIAYNLSELLMVLSCLLHLERYQDYYWLKFPDLQRKFGPQRVQLSEVIPRVDYLHKPTFFQSKPPSVLEFLNKIIACAKNETTENLAPYPNIPNVTNNSFIVLSLFCEMFQIDRGRAIFNISSTSLNFPSTSIITRKPSRSSSTDKRVVEMMVEFGKDRNYLSQLPEGINLYIWDAILNCRESPPTDWSEACFNLIGRMDLVNLVCRRSKRHGPHNIYKDREDDTLKLLFPDDIRVSEAHRMLSSDTPVEFSVTQRQGATEDESRDETHRHLYLLNVRTMAMPVGRGAICLRTYSPVIGESFEVPRLELSGRALSEERPIEYTHDISVYPWPFFHNGVAAGLTICASTANNIIDSTWINYNRPRSNIPHSADIRDRDLTAANINNEHAGFLFALGLNGHLEKLSLMALHDYLCQNNDLTKLAILLGMSASKRGSRDNNIIKVLSIHVDALLPPNSTELDVPAPVHAASIIGVGLLYQSSGDSHISKVLLEEIGRLPGPETNSHIDRESYSLSAGLAFGLVNLCKGGSSTLSSSDQLRLYMLGGKRKTLTLAQRERYFKQDCHRGEEEYINTHITSPGGTLGLGLMYHKSHNKSVANWMRAPDTQTLLEHVRPDFLILRMLSYGLIMWNEVEPNEDWINSHIPKIVSNHAFQRNSSPTPRLSASTAPNSTIDHELISQAYCNIVAGCCMAIAMRYAGTADQNAYKTIYKHTKMLIALSNKPALAEQAGRPCIESCLNVLVTSLAVVMAGTGDMGVMRVCRYLRSRLTQSCVFYGSHMAAHISLGILFLGACRYSLSTSPESIGALVCALFPVYPNHSSDNRYHLQALRHLYVLAAEPRLLIPRDIQTFRPVYVNITVKQRKSPQQVIVLKLQAPCLMPEVETIENVCVDDSRYWRMEINNKDALVRCLYRDQGYLSVKQKAHSSNNQLVKNIETYILQNMTPGVIKTRKSSALSECVKEDRVEQYSALNNLLTRSQALDNKFRSIILGQIRLSMTLADDKLSNKINLLKPLIGELEIELARSNAEKNWECYLTKSTDWTNTDLNVAYYITLNELKCSSPQDEHDLIECLHKLEHWNEIEDDDEEYEDD